MAHAAGREFGSPAELLAYRRTWQAQAGALLADGGMWRACEAADAATAAGLRCLLGVLAGDEGSLAGATASWLELLVAQLLHIYPSAKPQAELRQLAQRCFEAGGGAAASEFLQVAAALLEACAELDAQSAMHVCSAFCSDWFMAHAPDLMAAHPAGGSRACLPLSCLSKRWAGYWLPLLGTRWWQPRCSAERCCVHVFAWSANPCLPTWRIAGAGVLGQELRHAGGSQVEFYALEYAAALMPHAPTWPLAAAYLAWCPAHGQAALEALLARLPLDAGDSGVAGQAGEVAGLDGALHCTAGPAGCSCRVLC